jgi:DNA-binding XRE family transcriptional regulator
MHLDEAGATLGAGEYDFLGELDVEFKDRLKKARVEAGLTQQELGDLIGMSRQVINHLESGHMQSLKNQETFWLLPRVLHVNPEWLWRGHGEQYGGFYSFPVSDDTKQIALQLDHLTKEQKAIVREMVRSLSK